jgi:hypothetical protein
MNDHNIPDGEFRYIMKKLWEFRNPFGAVHNTEYVWSNELFSAILNDQ